MNGEENFHMGNTQKTERSQYDFCVLLLGSDATGLANLSEMMRNYGYRVVATTRAEDLPLIINNKDKKIDLVLAEFRLIEMNKYELLEKIKLICEIPVVVSGAYASDAIVECLCRGAKFCLNKPLMEDNLDYLWQFTFRSTVGREPDFLSQTDINISEKHDSVVHNQSLRDELKKNNNNEVKTEDLDEYKGENFESGDQKKPDLRCPEMQNEYRETDDEPNQGKKRKERAVTDTAEHTENDRGTDLEQQKKPKHICADDLQNKTLEAVPKIEEAGNERKKPTEIEKNGEGSEKKKPELGCMENELETWSTQPVTDFAAYAEYELEGRDFQPLESVGKSVDALEIASSPRESSNKSVVAQLQMPTDGALDEEVMWDGMSLSDLEFDLEEEEHGSNQELFDEIFNDLAKELKP